MNCLTLGIIGTAGRGEDREKLSLEKFNLMKVIAGGFIRANNIDRLVSGGAAWADSIVVQAYLRNFISHLNLELPCEFDMTEGRYKTEDKSGFTSNLYHQKFQFDTGINSLGEIKTAIEKGAVVKAGGGFFVRNGRVAERADILLAFTFGSGARLKDGGTADTVRKFLKTKDKSNAWHVNLNDMKLYQGAEV